MQLQRIRTDPHSPNRFRVDGTVYNVPEFAKAFNCPKGAKVCLSPSLAFSLLIARRVCLAEPAEEGAMLILVDESNVSNGL